MKNVSLSLFGPQGKCSGIALNPPAAPPLPGDGGGGMSHFSECLYRRDLGQIEILGGNWHFKWW